MSNAADIAVHTATVNGLLSAHSGHRWRARNAKLMLLKDDTVALRQKGASLGLIRELLAIVDAAVRTATIERFHAEMTFSSTSSRQRQRFNRRGDCVQKATS